MKLTRRSTAALTALCLGVAMLAAAPPSYAARDKSHGNSHGNSHGHDKGCHRIGSVRTMLECVTLPGVMEHERALQKIADANGGTRASATPGYDASAAYVIKRMRKAGYKVSTQPFPYFNFETVEGPSALEQTAPRLGDLRRGHRLRADAADRAGRRDRRRSRRSTCSSASGTPPPAAASPTDFAGFPAGNIALIQRGTCTFEIKAENAAAAGAICVLFFNQGNTADEDRNGIPAVTLGNGYTGGIPALNATYALGESWPTHRPHDAPVRERSPRGQQRPSTSSRSPRAATRATW